MSRFVRTILQTFTEGVYRAFTGEGHSEETMAGKVYQHFGFASRLPVGTELIVEQQGNSNISIAENDGNLRPTNLSVGDVAIYTGAANNIVWLKKNSNTVVIIADSVLLGGEVGGKALITEDLITAFNIHTHPVSGAVTGKPATSLTNIIATSKTKAL